MTRTPLLAVPIFEGRHELTLTRLKVADNSFTLRCTVVPQLPDSDSEPPLLPLLEAQDDPGNAYEDLGGAYGASPDGSHTDRSLTAWPALVPDASALQVRITFEQGAPVKRRTR
ncbi:hypothetical protein [Streptomyces sp. ME18-1-4]|uniref:hypothetical protein n=1 Tax=Streptomyces sp. ME18-1-4 TaxID=3028685 RepID=UPI0029B1E6A2|nr:hypothetical protein [Streptomyces sp. ME18-1-4]MDX3240288.1 hypothetical protein [Streptomyces sp. ME18-1-4]